MSQCATGCVQRGEHKPSCTGRCLGCRRSVERPHRKKCTDAADQAARAAIAVYGVVDIDEYRTCEGCLPRPAQPDSELCEWCGQRFTADVATAPALVRHLRLMAAPDAGAQAPEDAVSSGGDPAHRSMLSAAVSAADDLHALLATFAAMWVEDHPGSQGPPEWVQTKRGRRSLVVRTRQTVRTLDGESWVRHGDVAGIRDSAATKALVGWLLPRMSWFSAQPWAGEARTELAEMTASLRARWPVADLRERPVEGIPCPRCDQKVLTYTPPSWFRAPFTVACQNPECGQTFTEDGWEKFKTLVELDARKTRG